MTLKRRKALSRATVKRAVRRRQASLKLMPIELPANVRPMTGPGEGVAMQKRAVVQSSALRRSAQGEPCCVQIAGVCNHDPATTVLAHLPSEIGHTKDTDLSAVFACHACHDAIDGRVAHDWHGEREMYLRRGMVKTWTRWIEMGLIAVKGAT